MLRSMGLDGVLMVTTSGWAGRPVVVMSASKAMSTYAWGRRCKYCNDFRRNALTNKSFLTFF